MFAGFLIIAFFATIPFLYEFEALGAESDEPIKLSGVLRLQRFRHQRWSWAYLLLFALIAAIFLTPLVLGRSYPASLTMVLSVLAAQAAIWAYAYHRVVRKRRAHRQSNEDAI